MRSFIKCLNIVSVVLITIFFLIIPCHAMDITLKWTANRESNVVGYYLHYKSALRGGEPYNGTDAIEGVSPIYIAGRTTTTFTVTGLSSTKGYYFALTAINTGGLISGFSNECARFALIYFINGQGNVELLPSSGNYNEGTIVTLTANPAVGWYFDYWFGDLMNNINPQNIIMNSNKLINAVFIELPFQQYFLKIDKRGRGSISPSSGPYNENAVVTLTAIAAEGWEFDHWAGDLTGSTNPKDIIMSDNKSVTAVFIKLPTQQCSIVINTIGQGNVELSPSSGPYNENAVVTLTAIAAEGWEFDHWAGDLTGSTNPKDIIMNADKSVIAVFIEN